MPICEYKCLDCEKVFTVGVFLSERGRVIVQCPGCNSKKVLRQITSVSVKTESTTA